MHVGLFNRQSCEKVNTTDKNASCIHISVHTYLHDILNIIEISINRLTYILLQ